MKPNDVEWQCASCGMVSPGRVRLCYCATRVLFRMDRGRMLHEVKIASIADRTSLSRLRQAIIDNTKGDLFWIGEILLAELEKATGWTPSP